MTEPVRSTWSGLPLSGWDARWHPAGFARVVASHPTFPVEVEFLVDTDGRTRAFTDLGLFPGPVLAAREAVEIVPDEVFITVLIQRLVRECDAALAALTALAAAGTLSRRGREEASRVAVRAFLRLVGETLPTFEERMAGRALLAAGFVGTGAEFYRLVASAL